MHARAHLGIPSTTLLLAVVSLLGPSTSDAARLPHATAGPRLTIDAKPKAKSKQKAAKKSKKQTKASELSANRASESAGKNKDRTSKHTRSRRGRLGFGAQRTLSGNNAAFASYFVGRKFSLDWCFGAATFSHKEPDENGEFKKVRTVGMLATGPSAMFWPILGRTEHIVYADVGLGLRALLFFAFTGDDESDDPSQNTPMEVVIELPIATRLFIGRNVAITPEFGLAMRWTPGSREPDANGDFDENPGSGQGERLGTTNGPGWGFELGRHTGMFIGLSFAYFFDRVKK